MTEEAGRNLQVAEDAMLIAELRGQVSRLTSTVRRLARGRDAACAEVDLLTYRIARQQAEIAQLRWERNALHADVLHLLLERD